MSQINSFDTDTLVQNLFVHIFSLVWLKDGCMEASTSSSTHYVFYYSFDCWDQKVLIWLVGHPDKVRKQNLNVKLLTFPALLWSHNVLWSLMSSFSIRFHPLQEASYNPDWIRHTKTKGEKELIWGVSIQVLHSYMYELITFT